MDGSDKKDLDALGSRKSHQEGTIFFERNFTQFKKSLGQVGLLTLL
jgi:hypothetical protein